MVLSQVDTHMEKNKLWSLYHVIFQFNMNHRPNFKKLSLESLYKKPEKIPLWPEDSLGEIICNQYT